MEMSAVVSFLIKNKDILYKNEKTSKIYGPFFRRHLTTLDCIKYNTMYILHHLEKCLHLTKIRTFVDIFLDIKQYLQSIQQKYSRLANVFQLEKETKLNLQSCQRTVIYDIISIEIEYKHLHRCYFLFRFKLFNFSFWYNNPFLCNILYFRFNLTFICNLKDNNTLQER